VAFDEGRYHPRNITPLVGAKPWLRARVGELRIVYRPLRPEENPAGGWLVDSVVHRRDLDKAVKRTQR
jgi:hypothetical protein